MSHTGSELELTDIVVVGYGRSPIGAFRGYFKTTPAHQLAAQVISGVIDKYGIPREIIRQVILGQVLPAGQGQNPARQAAFLACLPDSTTAYSVNMMCCSGLKSVDIARKELIGDPDQVIIAGGMECMSLAPKIQIDANAPSNLVSSMIVDGLTDPKHGLMGVTADKVSEVCHISRARQDRYTFESHQKSFDAQSAGFFDSEIIPVVPANASESIKSDERIRSDFSLEALEGLPPYFKAYSSTVTAGNSSALADGAAVVAMTTVDFAKKNNLKIHAKILNYAQVGGDPSLMGILPIDAITSLSAKCGLSLERIGCFEINDAFAATSLAVLDKLQLQPCLVNALGGSITLGHPLGASGCRLLVTCISQMHRNNTRYGIVSLCAGGGMAAAMGIEVSQNF